MFDALIVGGGPAGAVTAIYLARAGARVAIVEATAYDISRFGETLPPEINPALGELGVWEAFRSLAPVEAAGIVSVWGSASAAEQDFVASPHGSGWRIDRNAFDAMLLREAEAAGARVFTKRKAAPRRSGGVWRAEGIAARFVIDASGKNGLALEGPCEREVEDTLLAIAMLVSYEGRPPEDRRTYIETAPSGWWYSGLLPDGDVMAMFLTDPVTYNTLGIGVGDELAVAELTRVRLENGRIRSSRIVHAPSWRRKRVYGEDWVAVGDSAAAYDPLSGRGIFKAVRNGAVAARALLRALDGDLGALEEYARSERQAFDEYARQRRAYYATERRWPNSLFWSGRGPAAARVPARARG